MTEAYPLQWPVGWPRTKRPEYARFDTSMAAARDALLKELRMLGAKSIVISTNIPLRMDGLPKANRRRPDDGGVAVYFTLNNNQQCIPCDKWTNVKDNMQALRLTVAALRGLERWGAKEMVAAAFSGFKALPASSSGEAWWDVLAVEQDSVPQEVLSAYRSLARQTHPDTGGSTGEFMRIQDAFDQSGYKG